MKKITYKKFIICPGLTNQIEIAGVRWLVRRCNREDILDDARNGHPVTLWDLTNARYQAYCIDKNKYFYLSRNYIKDIKYIMGLID